MQYLGLAIVVALLALIVLLVALRLLLGALVHGLVARHLWFCRAGAGRSDRLDRL